MSCEEGLPREMSFLSQKLWSDNSIVWIYLEEKSKFHTTPKLKKNCVWGEHILLTSIDPNYQTLKVNESVPQRSSTEKRLILYRETP